MIEQQAGHELPRDRKPHQRRGAEARRQDDRERHIERAEAAARHEEPERRPAPVTGAPLDARRTAVTTRSAADPAAKDTAAATTGDPSARANCAFTGACRAIKAPATIPRIAQNALDAGTGLLRPPAPRPARTRSCPGSRTGSPRLILSTIVHAFHDLAPDRVLLVEEAGIVEADEELRVGRVRGAGARHGADAAHMRLGC